LPYAGIIGAHPILHVSRIRVKMELHMARHGEEKKQAMVGIFQHV
jgi:hypothetical protein